MSLRWRFWRKWGRPSPAAQAACAQAEESSQRASRDLNRASAARHAADEVAAVIAEHNAANRFNEFLATRYGGQR